MLAAFHSVGVRYRERFLIIETFITFFLARLSAPKRGEGAFGLQTFEILLVRLA